MPRELKCVVCGSTKQVKKLVTTKGIKNALMDAIGVSSLDVCCDCTDTVVQLIRQELNKIIGRR